MVGPPRPTCQPVCIQYNRCRLTYICSLCMPPMHSPTLCPVPSKRYLQTTDLKYLVKPLFSMARAYKRGGSSSLLQWISLVVLFATTSPMSWAFPVVKDQHVSVSSSPRTLRLTCPHQVLSYSPINQKKTKSYHYTYETIVSLMLQTAAKHSRAECSFRLTVVDTCLGVC